MLVDEVSLRNLIPAELAKGFGFFHGKPSTAFSPWRSRWTLGAGTIAEVRSLTMGRQANQGGAGYTYLAEVRPIETILEVKAKTLYLKFGDRRREG